ncbi:MAG: Crp/Fnr family transcriptional regulator [Roseicyclus sp.]
MAGIARSAHRDTGRAPYWADPGSAAATAFERLSEATVQDIARHRSLELSSDRTKAVYFVLEGWLIISKSTEDGQRQIVDFVLPGEVFDPGSALADQSSTDLSALTRARVSIISQAGWQDLLRDHPELQKRLNRRVAASYSRIAERLLRIGKGSAEVRIAYAICELCLRSTDLGLVDGSKCHLPLTQQVLGDFVGLSSVHVSRTIRRLRRAEILRTGDHLDIYLDDVDRLAEVAEIDLDDLRAEIIPAA